MSGINEAEYQKLAAAVDSAEKVIQNGRSPVNGIISNFIMNAKNRMGVLDEEIGIVQEQSKKDKASTIALLVSQEIMLNTAEKEAYGNFLEKDYFTRDDLGELEAFYADGGAFDKLSSKGKDEMGIRLEEGIKRGEIEFSELSNTIQKKHNDWIYEQFTQREIPVGNLANVSSEARENFIREYEAGNNEAAHKILDQQGSSVYVQHEHKQSATSHSDVAAATKKNSADNVDKSDKNTPEAETLSSSGLSSMANLSQNPTDIQKPPSSGVELS